jgi:transcription-repair coupling factor
MKIADISLLYGELPQALALKKIIKEEQTNEIWLKNLKASAAPLLFSSVAKNSNEVFVFILSDADEAGYFYHDLHQLQGEKQVMFFPSSYKRAVKYGQRDAANEILRTEVLATLSRRESQNNLNEQPLFLVTYPEALAEMVVSKSFINDKIISLKVSQYYDIVALSKELTNLGFKSCDYVYEPGEFAVRGSLLDVYSFSHEYPFRIDFFGDEIDSIRTFEIESQLSRDKQEQIEILPELAKTNSKRMPLLRFLSNSSIVVLKDLSFVHEKVNQIYREGFSSQALTERLSGATEQEQAEIEKELQRENMLCSATMLAEDLAKLKKIEFGSTHTLTPQVSIEFDITAQPLFHKNFELLKNTFEDYLLKGYKLYIFADSAKQQQRLHDILNKETNQDGQSTDVKEYARISFISVDKTLHEGFIDNTLKACFFTDHQIFDRFHKYNLKSDSARLGKMALTLKELQEMEVGDFIVHVDLGIGKFGGLVRVPSGESYQEMIRIIYNNNDKVDLSIHSLYKISKYKRGDTEQAPRLSTLGTGAWERMKERTKKRIKNIARDLIKLYAKRRHEKGFAFSVDSFLQHALEASFLYEDTPDQLKATQEVKADMERERPMDRLVCGDVGFGKTEVAMRAAFKAACDNKQVAVLVPTTVLAYQHYQSFSSRFKDFPVKVDYLSRARSAKQTKQVLESLEKGETNILIGTHKLIGKSVKWHDLGLLVIDEEQKFGVSVKEKLRTLKTNVDTLTMSATPIPRTLQFSLMGARDMSIIRTPPPNRYPINTQLSTFSSEVIADAINFEMSRNGQVYFVNDRISNLPELARLIEKHVPDCRIAIGHGRMAPDELEKILIGFMNHDYDVLLSTTIIESGIDISNANTIIINDAHRFGLSDLHQMRGRVGRSNKKAFCYLLAPPKSLLKQDARRRLEALETFSELGSGFNLSMQDLDIRGAGNLLGSEQSGFMEDLGYETYQKILTQAVTELKNEEFTDLYSEEMEHGEAIKVSDFVDDCAVDSDLEMYFPDSYVPGSSERMLLYRELDNIENEGELEAYRQRLTDRFGAIPRQGIELMNVVTLRRIGKELGIEKIILRGGRMNLQLVANPKSLYYKSSAFESLLNYVGNHPRQCVIKEQKGVRMVVIAQVENVKEGITVLQNIHQS